MEISINKYFVYGTLRPDIQANWTSIVHKSNFNLKYYKATIPYSKLYLHNEYNYPIVIQDKNKFSEKESVKGYILECQNNKDEFRNVLDRIEGNPDFYYRKIVEIYNEDLKTKENVYIYFMTEKYFKIDEIIDIGTNDFAEYKKL